MGVSPVPSPLKTHLVSGFSPGKAEEPHKQNKHMYPRSISHLGTGEAPAAPCPWALSVLSAVLSSALQKKALKQALQGSSSELCSFCTSWQKCPAELRNLVVFPQQPQPSPGLTLQPLLLGSGWELSALETQEVLNPLHAGHEQQGQEGTRGTNSLQCIVPSTPELSRAQPGEGALLQGAWLPPLGKAFGSACKHLTML